MQAQILAWAMLKKPGYAISPPPPKKKAPEKIRNWRGPGHLNWGCQRRLHFPPSLWQAKRIPNANSGGKKGRLYCETGEGGEGRDCVPALDCLPPPSLLEVGISSECSFSPFLLFSFPRPPFEKGRKSGKRSSLGICFKKAERKGKAPLFCVCPAKFSGRENIYR